MADYGHVKISRKAYASDEHFVYIRADQLVEDLLLFSDNCDDRRLESRLTGWLAERGTAPLDCWAEIRDIIEDCRILPRERSRYIPAAARRAVLERDGGACVVCSSTEDLHFDHRKPFSRGGTHHPRNVQLLCRSCNLRKSAKTMEEWQHGTD
jgi:hypothetical protein